MTIWFIISGLAGAVALLLAWLMRSQQEIGAAKEQVRASHDIVEETENQARIASEHRTNRDVLGSLRRKAASKRKRGSFGNS